MGGIVFSFLQLGQGGSEMSSIVTPSPAMRPAPVVQPASLVRRHPVIAYWLLTLAISWLIWLPLIVQAQGWADLNVPFALHYLGAFGPMLAALIITWLTGGGAGLTELWSRIIRWRVGWVAWLAAVGSPIALYALSAVVTLAMGNPLPDLYLFGQVNYLPYLGLAVLPLWLATYGFGEEIGWRGFALPRLQNGRSALWASLILGVMWSVWHLPAFLYLETYLTLGLAIFPLFALGILCGAVLLTWLYNTARGSILIVAVWHALFDLVTAGKAADAIMQTVMSIVIMVLAVVVVIVFKPANLSREPKQVL
jgi:membrane protease YdiL (CAAX protease family)